MWFNFCAFLNWAAAGTVPSWSVSLGTVSKHFKSLFWKSAEVKKHPHGRATSGACPVQFHRCLAQVKCSPGPHPYSICGGNGSAQGRNCKKMLVIWFQERQICTSARDLTSHMRGSTNPCAPHTHSVSVLLSQLEQSLFSSQRFPLPPVWCICWDSY